MLLELLHSISLDASFIYFYLAIAVLSIGLMYIMNHHNGSMMEDYIFTNKHEYLKVNVNQMDKPVIINESFVVWLIQTYMKIDEKDDKADNTISYFNAYFKIRGGQLWNITYSQPLGSIVY